MAEVLMQRSMIAATVATAAAVAAGGVAFAANMGLLRSEPEVLGTLGSASIEATAPADPARSAALAPHPSETLQADPSQLVQPSQRSSQPAPIVRTETVYVDQYDQPPSAQPTNTDVEVLSEGLDAGDEPPPSPSEPGPTPTSSDHDDEADDDAAGPGDGPFDDDLTASETTASPGADEDSSVNHHEDRDDDAPESEESEYEAPEPEESEYEGGTDDD